MKLDLGQTEVRTSPGQPVTVSVRLVNDQPVIDVYSLEAEHVAGTVRSPLSDPVVTPDVFEHRLFPGDAATVELTITPHLGFEAGIHLIEISGVSRVGLPIARAALELHVAPVDDVRLAVRPAILRTRHKRATYQLAVQNRGNAWRSVRIEGDDNEGVVTFSFSRPQLELLPGEATIVDVVGRVRPPLVGADARREIAFVAADVHDPTKVSERAVAQLVQRPRLPPVLLLMGALALGLAVWALVLRAGVNDVAGIDEAGLSQEELQADADNEADPSGEAGSDNDAALSPEEADAAAAQEPGSIGGTVVAVSDGSPVPARVRIFAADGATAEPERVVRADANGEFTAEEIVPGRYLLHFDLPGFVPVWFGGSEVPAGALPLVLSGGEDLSVRQEVTGDPATIVGTVTVPASVASGTGASASAIRATDGGDVSLAQVLPDDVFVEVRLAGSLPTEEPIATATVVDDRFEIAGVPAPGRYVVTIRGPRYQPVTQEVTVAPGQVAALQPVELIGGGGLISGVVTDTAGQPLAGASVIVDANDAPLHLEMTTPGEPADAIGTYRTDPLTTPGTYTLTFLATGFQGRTLVVALEAGETRVLDVALGVGRGTLQGRVTDPAGNPLGDVAVTVAGVAGNGAAGRVGAAGATVTGGEAGGTYLFSGLEAPGLYTVTFARSDLATEAREISLAVDTNTLDVTMTPSSSSVSGTVTGPEGPLANVVVTLDDARGNGTTVSTSTTATGAFVFGNVPAGTYRIAVPSPPADLRPASEWLTLEPGEALSGLEFALVPRVGTLGVEVFDQRTSTSEPLFSPPGAAGATVEATSLAPGGPSVSATTDANGFAVLEDLLPGGYAVSATTADGGAVGETTAAVTVDRPVVVQVFTVPTTAPPPSTEVPPTSELPPTSEFPPTSGFGEA